MAQYRIILDANIWISFAIGKRMLVVRDLILDERVDIFTCQALFNEFTSVVQRPKLQKYLSPQRCAETLSLLEHATWQIEPTLTVSASRDVKDNYLLALAQTVKADYLLTGDDDLLVIKQFGTTQIMRFADFFKLFTPTA